MIPLKRECPPIALAPLARRESLCPECDGSGRLAEPYECRDPYCPECFDDFYGEVQGPREHDTCFVCRVRS